MAILRESWNVNRALVMAGALSLLVAILLFSGGEVRHLLSPQWIPMVPGLVAAAVLAFWARPWLYLLAGILLALFPLVIIAVFGAWAVLAHPSAGNDYTGTMFLLAAIVLSLLGGIAGFVQGRKTSQPAFARTLHVPQGVAAVVAIAVLGGLVLGSAFATADVRAIVTSPASNVIADEVVELDAVDYVFAPREVVIPAGKVVALKVTNKDNAIHIFAYHLAGELRQTPLPAKSEVIILLRFDEPQSIHFWCAPHGGSPDDTSEDTMWGRLVVQ